MRRVDHPSGAENCVTRGGGEKCDGGTWNQEALGVPCLDRGMRSTWKGKCGWMGSQLLFGINLKSKQTALCCVCVQPTACVCHSLCSDRTSVCQINLVCRGSDQQPGWISDAFSPAPRTRPRSADLLKKVKRHLGEKTEKGKSISRPFLQRD